MSLGTEWRCSLLHDPAQFEAPRRIERCQRLRGKRLHFCQQKAQFGIVCRGVWCGEEAAVAILRNRQCYLSVRQLFARPQIKEMPCNARRWRWHREHCGRPICRLVLAAADNRPRGGVFQRPVGGKRTIWRACARVRCPARGLEVVSAAAEEAQEHTQPSNRFAVHLSDADPGAPHVLPRFKAHAVEPRELQRVLVILAPALADVCHAAGVEPLPRVDRRRVWIGPIAPAHRVSVAG